MEMDLEPSRRSAAFASSFVEDCVLEISALEHVSEDVRHHDGTYLRLSPGALLCSETRKDQFLLLPGKCRNPPALRPLLS